VNDVDMMASASTPGVSASDRPVRQVDADVVGADHPADRAPARG
jgi:hypothetical protein